ncbi:YkvA family protein [Fictibacillus aquaticus]|nr:YkvA family protein [Fictibacillus aquaticus]
MLEKLKLKARLLKRELFVLYLSYRDPGVPMHAKITAIIVVAYAFSPIDLIPDFIPIIGYLDDLILVPLGIALALKLIPSQIIDKHRAKAAEIANASKPKNWFIGALFILIWITAAYWLGIKVISWMQH